MHPFTHTAVDNGVNVGAVSHQSRVGRDGSLAATIGKKYEGEIVMQDLLHVAV
jgi:hypothetical protein